MDEYILAEDLLNEIDGISSDADDYAANADHIVECMMRRLDNQMPDEIGRVWKLIASKVQELVEIGLASEIADAVVPAMKRVVDRLEKSDPKLTDLIGLDDDSGRELGAALAEASNLDRVAFFRGLLDGLDRTALDDLQAEIVRR